MTVLLILLGTGCAVLLAGLYSGMETASYSASRTRLNALRAEGDTRAERTLTLLNDLARLVTTTLIGHNLSVYISTFLLTRFLEERRAPDAEAWATLILTPVCLVFAEVLPKRLAHGRPNDFLVHTVQTLDVSRRVFLPLGAFLGAISWLLHRLVDRWGGISKPMEGRTRLIEYLEASHAEGLLTEQQHRIAQRIMSIQEQTVRRVMIPFPQAFAVREDQPCGEAARAMLEANHNRAPLLDRSGRPVARIVALNHILRAPGSLDQAVSSVAIDGLALDANTSISKALRRMQEEGVRLALVSGRGNAPIGVLRLSDLLSTIVGTMKL
jgi:putative hemolysin